MLGAMAQPEKNDAAVRANAMLEALTEIFKSQSSGLFTTMMSSHSFLVENLYFSESVPG